MAGGGVKAVARGAHPAVAAVSGAIGAGRTAEGGMGARASAGAQELVQNYEARKKARERHQTRMANMGRRSTFTRPTVAWEVSPLWSTISTSLPAFSSSR